MRNQWNDNRITEIYPPSELDSNGEPNANSLPAVKYNYDDCGNLTEVSKLIDRQSGRYETTTYVYDDNDSIFSTHDKRLNHYVYKIKDPRGITPVQYLYDCNGLLVGVKDAKGNEIAIDNNNIAGRKEVIADRSGNVTIHTYDDRGDIISTIDALGKETRYDFNDPCNPDKPTTVTDPLGHKTRYTYDKKGRTASITDPVGNVTQNDYDNNGNISDTWQYYTPDPCQPNTIVLVSQTHNEYPNGLLTLTQALDPNGDIVSQTEQAYDSYNRLIKVNQVDLNHTEPNIVTTYAYDSASGSITEPCSVTDAAGLKTFFLYNTNGNQIKSWYQWIDPANSANYCNVYTVTIYDDAGRVIQTQREVNDVGGSVAQSTVTLSQTIYNSLGKVDTSINELNNSTKYYYDETGNLVETDTCAPNGDVMTISQTLYDKDGRVLVTVGPYDSTNSSNVGTENVYDALGRVIETRRWKNVVIPLEDIVVDNVTVGRKLPSNVVIGNAVGSIAYIISLQEVNNDEYIGWWSRRENGDLKWPAMFGTADDLIHPLSYSRTVYDDAGRVKTTISLDERGYEWPTSYAYDDAGKQTAVIDPCGHTIAYNYDSGLGVYRVDINSLGFNGTHRTETQYEGNRRKAVVDALGNTTSFSYDAMGRVIKTTYPATTQNPVTYSYTEYDGFGRKTFESQQTAETNPSNAVGKTFDYDSAGRLSRVWLSAVIDPRTSQWSEPCYIYGYDIYGDIVSQHDSLGRQTRFTYDYLHNQTSRILPDNRTEYKEYDNLGRLTKATDFKGQIIGYFYDSLGRLWYEKYYYNGSYYPTSPANVIEYEYDNLGRRVSTAIDSNTYGYQYDAENRVLLVTSPQGEIGYDYNTITGKQQFVRTPADGTDTKVEYGYDAIGRLADVTVHKRNGVTANDKSTYGYNAVGSLDLLCHPNGDCSTYTYDSLNRLTELKNEDGLSNVLSRFVYQLANNGRRQSVAETFTGQQTNIAWGYDNLNRLTSESYDAPGTSDDYSQTYTYDLVGNRVSDVLNSTATYYHYNNRDQLLNETSDPAGTNILAQYQYDDNGSMMQKAVTGGNTFVYGYDLFNHLTSFTVGGTTTRCGQWARRWRKFPHC